LLAATYHHTIKAVVQLTQVSLPTLIKHLLQLSDVRQLTAQHAAFDCQLKHPVNIPVQLTEYNKVLSQFASEMVRKEFNKGLSREADPDFTGP